MTEGKDFSRFFAFRAAVAVVLGVIVLWIAWVLLGFFDHRGGPQQEETVALERDHRGEETYVAAQQESGDMPWSSSEGEEAGQESAPPSVHEAPAPSPREPAAPAMEPAAPRGVTAAPPAHEPSAEPSAFPPHEERPRGVAFVEATVAAMNYELNERFWGWRLNDIVNVTDNVDNMQLGVLEVVRRTSVNLAERITRYGMTDLIDKNLENAMNWFMIEPDRYWLPSSEKKYNDGLNELRKYSAKLSRGEGRFYVRADNLIPLLNSLADLMGSCDENLVKEKEADGSTVSWFKTDDYFYYAKGVATAMGKILHAVNEDFAGILETRHGADLMERAIHACHVASELDPWLVTDASLDGVFANHRANMAAPIAHARYFLDALVKALST